MAKRLTTKEFILKARKVHGDKYFYEKTSYVNTLTKVKINCKKCGTTFKQPPKEHLKGKGCLNCGGSKKLTRKEFIKKSQKVHGNTHIYSHVEYVNVTTRVKITCKKCKNEFLKTPNKHLLGQGCPLCSKRHQGEKSRILVTDFEKKANKKHNEKYKYFQDYEGSRSKIRIKCPEHGVFYQKAGDHLLGRGCWECSIQKQTKTFKEFEKEVIKTHNGRYSYFQDYKKGGVKVNIKCSEHGVFKQTPHAHLNGHGCPKCAGLKTENDVLSLVSKMLRLKFLKVRLLELQGLELDGYNKHKRLAIEYQGEGHFLRYADEKGHFLKRKNILSHQKRDRKKKRLCKKHGIKLVCIPCYEWKRLNTEVEKRKYLKNTVIIL